jgi:endo-1,3(4)-beta-glucanase
VKRPNQYQITLNNGQKWLLYFDGLLNLTLSAGHQIVNTGGYSGALRLILVADESSTTAINKTFDTSIDTYAGIYPVGGQVTTEVTTVGSDSIAKINFLWKTQNMSMSLLPNASLLMYNLIHHRDTLPTQSLNTSLPVYSTIKGKMLPYSGNTWTMTEKLTKTSFNTKLGIDPQYHSEVISALQTDRNIVPTSTDIYFYAKELSKMAQIILIADEVKQPDIVTSVLEKLKTQLVAFLTSKYVDSFVYDTTWKGLVTVNGIKDKNADFGRGWYNDSHFHAGYYLHSLAVVCRYDTTFFNAYKNQILSIVRDIGNSSTLDTYFPMTRCKDWFAGHSWATGIFSFADVKNQESSSEALNAYYGMYLLGQSIGNKQIEDLGRIMYATELRSIKHYWQIVDTSVYSEPFASNTICGMIWSTKVDYATWFGPNVEFIHCINMLPFTAASEDLLGIDWIRKQQPILDKALTRIDPKIEDGWLGFVQMSRAVFDPVTAHKWITEFKGQFDNGNTRSNTLYWILTRPGLGVVRTGPIVPLKTITIDSTTGINTLILNGPLTLNIKINSGVVLKYV